ncbi:endonuclease/exonuclease/phosphatase family protein [Microbacterium sp. ASV49]|uniref:Endonuclease/exonuclease/phosphatase family protein n=1 Tax=Microbacterium candidum TaxID=3041922 RepID=A0ABT7N2J3_9MICO|nr:endonuclease/exonuclease/phosphatase family protein [Microbacterium sp. ASV49]MDL9980880.1 endonuclease/exonuclease/phosphatase family protein [Microbacterium sp. ASV49]
MLRVLGVIAALVCAAAALLLTWPQILKLERTYPFAQTIAFRGVDVAVCIALMILLLLLALIRPVRPIALALAIVVALAAIAGGAILLVRGVGADALPAKGTKSVRVLTWNTAGSATSPETIARTAVAMDADIVSLPETTISTGEKVALAMRGMNHRMWAYHTQYGAHGWDASSTTLLISPRLGDYSVVESSVNGSTGTSTVPSVVAMPVNGSGPVVVAAHAVAPREAYLTRWRSDLRWLADQCGSTNVIMAGDFNATVDHMSGLGIGGATLGKCTDAAQSTGNGAVGTWPTSMPALLGSPIDHVMTTTAWRASGSVVLESLDGSGSDHRPLVVQLEPAS